MHFDDDHCSRWSGIPQDVLSNANRKHIEILSRSFRTGVYNLPVNWNSVEWYLAQTTFSVIRSDLATYDFDYLTRLVILAHDECVRVSISPHTFDRLKIKMWSDRKRAGAMNERHPTIEEAIAAVRG